MLNSRVVAIVACFVFSTSLFALPFTSTVVFGDSLSDPGNAYLATGGTQAAPPAYGNGQFTDGLNSYPSTTGPQGVWVQQFADKLGLPASTPFLAGGTNYAVGSAQTGVNPAFSPTQSPPLSAPGTTDQVNLYLARTGAQVPSDALYILWAGANDLPGGTSPLTSVQNLSNDITTLASHGARNFLWFNLPSLGDTPAARAAGPFAVTALNAATSVFNAAWAQAIPTLENADPQLHIIGADVNGLFSQILANPAAYGFANVTDPAQGQNVDPNTYLFWDGLHPTTSGAALVANLAAADVTNPEPSSMILTAAGIVLAAAIVRKRRAL